MKNCVKFYVVFSILSVALLCSSCSSLDNRNNKAKEIFPNEVTLGTLVQLNTDKMLYGSMKGTTGGIFTRGRITGNIGEDYYYVGLYETPEGYIKSFKIPAKDAYLVNSNSYSIQLTNFHKYIEGMNLNIYNSNGNYGYVAAIQNVIDNSTNRNIHRGCGDPSCGCQNHTPKIKICIPTDCIERYIRIEF